MKATPAIASSLTTLGLLIIALPFAVSVILSGLSLADIRPREPWDAAIIADGFRAAHGLPVYEPPPNGHATSMYGPAQPVLLGALFRLLATSHLVPQVLSLGCATVLCLGGVIFLRRQVSAPYLLIFGLALASIDLRTGGYFTSIRPDLAAWTFGLAGVASSFALAPRRPVLGNVIAAALVVFGFLFKQPAGVLAIVFPIAFMSAERLRSNAWLSSWLPAFAVTLTAATIWAFAPAVARYMFVEPATFPISAAAAVKSAWGLLGGATCLWVGLVVFLTQSAGTPPASRRRLVWCFTSFATTFAVGVLTFSKVGGSANAFIPAWFTLLVLSGHLVCTHLTASWSELLNSARAALLFLATACALTFSVAPDLNSVFSPFGIASANAAIARGQARVARDAISYRSVIAYVRSLRGTVLSPDDPTITMFARGAPGRSWVEEWDASNWPDTVPSTMLADYSQAAFIVSDVDRWRPRQIAGLGFRPVWSNGQYVVWERRSSWLQSLRRPGSG